MGCTVREKHVRSARKGRSVNKAEMDPCCLGSSIPKSVLESGLKPLPCHVCMNDPNSSSNSNVGCDENGWGYCTEDQLEDILLKNLELLYKEAVSKLVGLGYDEDVGLKAILRNGHCYGGMDVLTNILHNALAYLNSNNGGSGNEGLDEPELVFSDLRQLEEYSLAAMVCLLQQVKPHLSKGDAMWCLLMSELHVGRASAIEMPSTHAPANGGIALQGNVGNVAGVGSAGLDNGVGAMAPALCRFHGGWGFGNGQEPDGTIDGFFSYNNEMTLQRDIECPKRFNLSPSMKSLLKKNVAMFAAGFRANSKQMQTQTQVQPQLCANILSSGGDAAAVAPGDEISAQNGGDGQNQKSQDEVNSMLSRFRDLNLDGNSELAGENQRDEMIVTLLHQIKDLEKQVKERKEWAHEKAMQAARKLCNDLTELKMLRMEREETQRLKKGKQTLEDSTMKRLSEMENALRKASSQVDRANAAVRRLENENAEIRAEMEAFKLNASESVTACLEVGKREKKCIKKLLAWEKQRSKLQEEIVVEQEKIKELQQQLAMIEQAQKCAEEKWRQEVKAKEQAMALAEEERRSKEAAEANNKRKLEALRLKIEIDFQRNKDDLQRLEQELSRLKLHAEATELDNQPSILPSGKPERKKPQGETIAKLLNDLDKLEDSSERQGNCDRQCIVCRKDEVCIVFLPCAHLVMCARCSDNYGKKGKTSCPCCRIPVEKRIRVFGASS